MHNFSLVSTTEISFNKKKQNEKKKKNIYMYIYRD